MERSGCRITLDYFLAFLRESQDSDAHMFQSDKQFKFEEALPVTVIFCFVFLSVEVVFPALLFFFCVRYSFLLDFINRTVTIRLKLLLIGLSLFGLSFCQEEHVSTPPPPKSWFWDSFFFFDSSIFNLQWWDAVLQKRLAWALFVLLQSMCY